MFFKAIILFLIAFQIQARDTSLHNRVAYQVSQTYLTKSGIPQKYDNSELKTIRLNRSWRGSDKQGFTYLNEEERAHYQVDFKNGLIVNSKGHTLDSGNSEFIFILDKDKRLLISARYRPNLFEHHSLVAGEDVYAAGKIRISRGKVTYINDFSPQYPKRSNQNLNKVIQILRENNATHNLKAIYQ